MLPDIPIELGASAYLAIVPKLLRYRGWIPPGEPETPAWSDESTFADRLRDQELPRALAVFLYDHAPERSLDINAGSLWGVEMLIDENSRDDYVIREAGFFIMGAGPNGDPLVIDLRQKGVVGFFDHGSHIYNDSPIELRSRFIPIAPSIGEYLASSEHDNSLPRDYWSSVEWQKAKADSKN